MGMRKRFDNDDMMRLSFSFHESDLLCLIVLEISLNLSSFSSGCYPDLNSMRLLCRTPL